MSPCSLTLQQFHLKCFGLLLEPSSQCQTCLYCNASSLTRAWAANNDGLCSLIMVLPWIQRVASSGKGEIRGLNQMPSQCLCRRSHMFQRLLLLSDRPLSLRVVVPRIGASHQLLGRSNWKGSRWPVTRRLGGERGRIRRHRSKVKEAMAP